MLAAGIDVISTLNVQHLESLNDHVTELSGIRVRETIPDAILAPRRRGRADRPHSRGAARSPARGQGLPARAHRRGAEQLLPDREPRGAARGRAAPGRRGRRRQAPDHRARAARARRASPPTRRRRSASACSRSSSPTRAAQRLVRRAWRSAQRLGADLDLLWVRPPGRRLSEDEERSLAALRQLASVLGANMLEEESDDVAATVVDVAAPSRHHLHPDRPLAPARAASRGCARRCPSA